jgi:uncharacterized membrane protein YhaH (DUF805 family)
LLPDLAGLVAQFAIVTAFAVLLLAAAVARRLHDRGRSGLVGLLPLPFLGIGFAIMPQLFHVAVARTPDLHALGRLFPLLFVNNLVYLASLAYLVVQLVSPGTSGPNRFGEGALDR